MRVEVDRKSLAKILDVVCESIAEWIIDGFREELKRKDAIATGYLYRSFMVMKSGECEYEVVNVAPYSEVLEFGCLPHRPPYEEILNWVKIKKKEVGEEAERAAWRIVRKIEYEGYAPRYYARDFLRQIDGKVVEVRFGGENNEL